MATNEGKGRTRGELLVAAGFMSVAGLVFWRTNTAFAAAGANEGGALFDAAFYPELLAGLMAILALLQCVAVLRGARAHQPVSDNISEPPRESDASLARALALVGLFLLWLITFRWIGYHLTTPVFLGAAFMTLGVRPLLAIPTGIAVSLGASLIFEWGMNVILPVGRWEIGF